MHLHPEFASIRPTALKALDPSRELKLLSSIGHCRNLSREELVAEGLWTKQLSPSNLKVPVVDTGRFTGRTPKDRYLVRRVGQSAAIDWGAVNQPIDAAHFDELYGLCIRHLRRRALFVTDVYSGQDPQYRKSVRILTEKPWQSHFCLNMFIEPTEEELKSFRPDFTIVNASSVTNPDYERMGMNSEVFVAFDLERRVGIIGGTEYGGEMKKGMFSVMNTLLPDQDVLPMHCAANVDEREQVALFFGLSGTGKTTLSTTSECSMIGDDEHGWSEQGVFNLEGGCYAKTAHLDPELEPEIYSAIRPGALLENVKLLADGALDFSDLSRTPNARVSYPLSHLEGVHALNGRARTPETVFFLTCDAFAVLPPISRLNTKQALLHFVLGYTAKVAGTECGVAAPEATFSACFGAPFMTLHPLRYASLLEQRLESSNAEVFLVNTGWRGGPVGSGHRMPLPMTRDLVDAARAGRMQSARTAPDHRLGLTAICDAPQFEPKELSQEQSWGDGDAYAAAHRELSSKLRGALEKVVSTAPSQLQPLGRELLCLVPEGQ